MAYTVKITAIGDSLGILLPEAILDALKVSVGDTLYVTETPNGIELSSEFSQTMESARKIMIENREALRRLAE